MWKQEWVAHTVCKKHSSAWACYLWEGVIISPVYSWEDVFRWETKGFFILVLSFPVKFKTATWYLNLLSLTYSFSFRIINSSRFRKTAMSKVFCDKCYEARSDWHYCLLNIEYRPHPNEGYFATVNENLSSSYFALDKTRPSTEGHHVGVVE